MQIVSSWFLDDGNGHNKGQPADLIRIESADDFDRLVQIMAETNYYDSDYFKDHIGHGDTVKDDSFWMFSLVRSLAPCAMLDIGCGKAETLLLLKMGDGTEVRGIDISDDIVASALPPVRPHLDCGEALDVSRQYVSEGRVFDTIMALDIWEHLHPARLSETIEAVVRMASEDALFFVNVPGFGHDRVFGERFPLEFEENRAASEAGQPFSYLLAESVDPPIPANGHLIWAPASWWEEQFRGSGLERCESLERQLHDVFDGDLFYARRAFFVFRKETPRAARRVEELLGGQHSALADAKALQRCARAAVAYEREFGEAMLDWARLREMQWLLLLRQQSGLESRLQARLPALLAKPLLVFVRLLGGLCRRVAMLAWRMSA